MRAMAALCATQGGSLLRQTVLWRVGDCSTACMMRPAPFRRALVHGNLRAPRCPTPVDISVPATANASTLIRFFAARRLRNKAPTLWVGRARMSSTASGANEAASSFVKDSAASLCSGISSPPAASPLPSHASVLHSLPMVQPSKELLNRAFRRANAQRHNKKIKNEASQERSRTARTMETFQKELGASLGLYVSSFPKVEALTSFDAALLDLTVGKGAYEQTLDRVAVVKKTVARMAKELATRGARAQTKKEAELVREQGLADLEKYLKNAAGAVDSLLDIAKLLRRLPVVDPRLPTVALVGAPNVGKSSLVQALSSGQPEIQNYPFTTRTIKMGHFYVRGQRHQVTDTPGLLARSEADRNVMERLTLATLDFLPTAVLFVADLTEECGASVGQQWAVRAALKARFPRKRWVDVFSKADLLEGMRRRGQEERGSAVAQRDQAEVDLNPSLVKRPSDWPRYLPRAIWASSFTDAGCAQLKGAILEALAHPEGGEEMETVESSEGRSDLNLV